MNSTTPQMLRAGVYRMRDAEVYSVDSDTTTRIYRVTIWAGSADCTCKAGRTCKHIRRVMAARES